MRAYDIQWDTDGDKAASRGLPSSMEVPDGMTDPEEISDYLTGATGFCHSGFRLGPGTGNG